MKLLVSPFDGSACALRKVSIFCATGLRFVILFPGNAMRPPTKPVGQEGVDGSNISPRRMGVLSQGLRTGIGGPPGVGLAVVMSGPRMAEKSPPRSASVGRVDWLVAPTLFRY